MEFPISIPPASFFKTLLLVILCGIIAGIAGVLTIVLMYWMTHQPFAIDSHEKHGISHQRASRLGGIAVAFCAFCIYWLSIGMDIPLARSGEVIFSNPVTYALLVGLIGFCDDVLGHISARARILLSALIFTSCFIANPGYIPAGIGVPGLDAMLTYVWIAIPLCVFGCLGMLNATNMADGANGLMPLVFMGSFYGFFITTGELVYFALTMGLMIFGLFNVLSGKLFLGDAGTYGLGAMAALSAIKIMSQTGAEVWFFLCLAAYPVIDFFASMTRRMISGRSPLSADSDHMHNRLYRCFSGYLGSPLLANSASGLTLSLATTGVSVALLSYWHTSSINWITLFAALAVFYLVAFYMLPSTCQAEDAT